MAINNNLGFKETVQALGLKRRFFGFESDKSLARRVFKKLGTVNSFVPFMAKIFNPPPRVCINEQPIESKSCDIPEGGSLWLVGWKFNYNDGTTESVYRSEVRS